MFKRKHVNRWSAKRWLRQVHCCFVAGPAEGGRRATIVVHMDPRLLPRNTEDLMRQECLEVGEPWEGFREFAVFCLECKPTDYAGYRMGDTVHEMMKDLYREVTIEAAAETSIEWIGTDPIRTDLRHIPGLFQAAFLADTTEKEPDLGGAEYLWVLPTSDGPERTVSFPVVTN